VRTAAMRCADGSRGSGKSNSGPFNAVLDQINNNNRPPSSSAKSEELTNIPPV
jgi:hypothetical protein